MSSQRINRRSFVASLVVAVAPFLAITAISTVADGRHGSAQNTLYTIFTILIIVCLIGFLITSLAAVIKRLHDVGWPWVLVVVCGLFTPFIVVLALVPGQADKNQYGNVPAKNFDLRSAFIWW